MSDFEIANRRLGEESPLPEPGGAEDRGSERSDAADEFDPRYCVRCHKRISVALSDRQGVCDECMRALEALANTPIGPSLAAYGIGPYGSSKPICPKCGSENVEREWVTDWASTAADVAATLAALALGALAASSSYGRGYHPVKGDSSPDEAGTVKVMRHRCADCDFHWKAN